jgi:hypothetical protein
MKREILLRNFLLQKKLIHKRNTKLQNKNTLIKTAVFSLTHKVRRTAWLKPINYFLSESAITSYFAGRTDAL